MPKIGSHSAAWMKRGVRLYTKYATHLGNGSATWNETKLPTIFIENREGSDMNSTITMMHPVTGSIMCDKNVSFYNAKRSFGLNKKIGLAVDTCLLRSNTSFLEGVAIVR